jgi:hypothetical protein
MLDEVRYRFMEDDDGHTYLIAVGQEAAFLKWLAAAPYWEGYEGKDFERWRLDGDPSRFTFTDPRMQPEGNDQ